MFRNFPRQFTSSSELRFAGVGVVLFRTFPRPTLQNLAGALLPERVDLLRGESHQQTILAFVFRYVLDNVRDGLGDRNALDGRLPPELLRDGPLLLQVRRYDVHHCGL